MVRHEENQILRKRIWITIIVFFLLLVISAAIIIFAAFQQRDHSKEHAGYVASGEIGKLQYAIDSRLMTTDTLEMVVVDGDGKINHFDELAERLYEEDPSIRSIQLAPDGVVTYVYPKEGNEEAYGDLFQDPDRKKEAEYARDTGEMTLAGPFELYQGGMGLVARNPIYIEDSSGKEQFWGFCIVVLNVPELFEDAGLQELTGLGYEYRIWRIDPNTNDKQVIKESRQGELKDPINREIQVPGGTWMVSICPTEGWFPVRDIVADGVIALIICILLALVASNISTIEYQKRHQTFLANTDALTAIYNDRFLSSVMEEKIMEKSPFGLVYLDLDHFKGVNDQYGHDVGDMFLKETAERIKSCITPEDMAFRIGGDEFAIVVDGVHEEEYYEELNQQLQAAVGQKIHIGQAQIVPHVSCGYARFPEDCQSKDALRRMADQKMYEEKRGYHQKAGHSL